MYNLTFNKKENLLLVDVQGEILTSEMIENIKKLENYRKYTDTLYILQDSRKMETKFELVDIPAIADEFEKILKKFRFIKHADVHQVPSSTGYALIYQYKTRFSNYKYEVFNTTESASKWLMEVVNKKSSLYLDLKDLHEAKSSHNKEKV